MNGSPLGDVSTIDNLILMMVQDGSTALMCLDPTLVHTLLAGWIHGPHEGQL